MSNALEKTGIPVTVLIVAGAGIEQEEQSHVQEHWKCFRVMNLVRE